MALVDVWNLGKHEVQYGGGRRLPAGRCLKKKSLQDLPAGLILLAEDKASKVFVVPHGTPKTELPGQKPQEEKKKEKKSDKDSDSPKKESKASKKKKKKKKKSS